jgi:hypothetical protein
MSSEDYDVVLARVNSNKKSWASLKVSKQKYSASRRGIKWKLNDWEIARQIEEATECALSGRKLIHEISNLDAPSIDRKYSSEGYLNWNTQIVCTIINKMKGELTVSEFVQRCREVAGHADKNIPKV